MTKEVKMVVDREGRLRHTSKPAITKKDQKMEAQHKNRMARKGKSKKGWIGY